MKEQTSLQGIAKKAATNKSYRFQNLYGLITVNFLVWCWQFINKKAASGVDKETAELFAQELYPRAEKLVEQLKKKCYRAKLVLRKYIPKGKDKLRALGLPVIADKLLQMSATKILEAIYEQDFYSYSYGYRVGKSAHDAIRELSTILNSRQYHYVVEADIRSFFDKIDHDILLELLSRRINDRAFLNLIRKWLKAGILEEDMVIHPITGTPQGGVISPVLANIYLHYAIDVWFEEEIKLKSKGKTYLCRYADDFVCVFECEVDAQNFYNLLRQRLADFSLGVAEEKTQLMKFSHFDIKMSAIFVFLGFEFAGD
jgi:group II intron reverse transcriptase/maturase